MIKFLLSAVGLLVVLFFGYVGVLKFAQWYSTK